VLLLLLRCRVTSGAATGQAHTRLGCDGVGMAATATA